MKSELIAVLVGVFWGYIFGVFISWEFSPGAWSVELRGIAFILFFMVAVLTLNKERGARRK